MGSVGQVVVPGNQDGGFTSGLVKTPGEERRGDGGGLRYVGSREDLRTSSEQ